MTRTGFLFVLAVAVLLGSRSASAGELSSEAATTLEVTTFASGTELITAIEFLPDGALVIAEKTGRVLVRKPDGELIVAGTLDVDSKTEKGLLNVIRDPAFPTTRNLIFYYSSATAPELDKHKVALIRLGEDNRLDLASEKVLLKGLRGPDDHEMGGGLAIDSTGHLLVGVGDTGCRARKLPEPPYTPTNYFATCLTNGNGKILRIGLDGSIPADNPLVSTEAVTTCGEKCADDAFKLPPSAPRQDIWVWGLRNPWRLWTDPKTGRVWVGDVGDIAHEEIDIIPKEGGIHLGWPFREGAAGHPPAICRKTLPDRGDCVDPAYFCRHDDVPGDADAGCKSINGGLIVDDCRWPDAYRGRYFFADNANGRIWTLEPTPARDGIVKGSRHDIGQVNGFVVDLELGPDGALYLAIMRIPPEESRIIRIAPKVPRACNADGTASPAAARPVERSKSPELLSPMHPKRRGRRFAFLAIAALALLIAAALIVRGPPKA